MIESIFSILFLIYIGKIFSQIKKKLFGIIYILFVNDLNFLTFDYSISIIAKLLKKTSKINLEWGANNAVTNNINKTKIILVFKASHQKLAKQILETLLRFGKEIVFFN